MPLGLAVDENDVQSIVQQLQAKVTGIPEVGIICGSGLGGLAKTLQRSIVVPYEDIEGFPKSTVEGHAGELHFGYIGEKFVVCMRGRFHFYEGYHPTQVAVGVRVMAALGIRVLVVTNAAGGVNPAFNVGDLMMINDHICLMGMAGINPLVGPNASAFGPRFPPVCDTYNPRLREELSKSCEALGLFQNTLRNGVYFGVSGPSYETPHEIQMMRSLKADSVGMSTVFEVLAAAHCSLPVLGLSTITNRCKGPDDQYPAPSHQEVLDAVVGCQDNIQAVVSHFVTHLDLSPYPVTKAYTEVPKLTPKPKAPQKSGCPGKSCHALVLGTAALALGIAYLLRRKL